MSAGILARIALGLLGGLMLWLATPAAAQAGAPLKVMTFNIRLPLAQDGPDEWSHRRDFAAALLRRERPDIIGMQEMHKVQGDYLLGRLPGYAWFGIDRRGRHGDEHMAIFYRRDRLELLELGNFWLSETPHVPGSISWGHPFPRMATWGLFRAKDNGRRFYALNTHLPYRAEDAEARTRGASQIVQWTETLPADVPVIVTGDFNTLPDGPVHDVLAAGLKDARLNAASRAGPGATFHAFSGKPDRRIDWILTRGFEARSARTLTDNRRGRYPSDHFPVVATLAWKQP